jgi:hypothetical protein
VSAHARPLLSFGGALAGASGSAIRLVWTNEVPASALRTGVLGLVAGGVSAIFYLLAQVASNPAVLGIGSPGAASAPQPNALLVVAVWSALSPGSPPWHRLALPGPGPREEAEAPQIRPAPLGSFAGAQGSDNFLRPTEWCSAGGCRCRPRGQP